MPLWKEAGTQIIAQKHHVDFMNYQTRLAGFYAKRNAAQFALNIPEPARWAGNYAAKIEPTILFDDKYEFTLGGVKFEIYSAPSETYDHLMVWVPKYKALFSTLSFDIRGGQTPRHPLSGSAYPRVAPPRPRVRFP